MTKTPTRAARKSSSKTDCFPVSLPKLPAVKLYKRPLKGLADLKREIVLLEYMRGEQKTEDLFSAEGIRRGGKKKKKKSLADQEAPGSGLLGVAMSLMGAKSIPQALFQGGSPALSLLGKALPKKKIAGFVWEIVGGYLKWRAVEAGVWGIKQLIKAGKEKKRFAAEARQHHPVHQHHSGKKKIASLFR